MKKVMLVLGFIFTASFICSAEEPNQVGYGYEEMQDAPKIDPKEGAEKAKSVEVGNKICPVSGEEVGKMGEAVKYEYKGKIYNLCCNMCIKDFSQDPDKYSKIADDEVAKQPITP